ncbi:hypothetical protein O181_035460 [Austropuccinia psidii MF-1]|uniref:Uncharacterized protein n=1 Tax=Austropuccinia psidii MF-1 TaxID=1389203 RepID=A0A9Q3HB74_9BASI|nr:hypothetical protein [Austropuccinia psidii MF-1]
MLYPFGTEAVVHIPDSQKHHELAARGTTCHLLKPLMMGSWLLWDPESDKMVQSTSIIFPCFQSLGVSAVDHPRGSLSHILNPVALGKVPKEQCFEDENQAIDSLMLTKDIKVPKNLGQALPR